MVKGDRMLSVDLARAIGIVLVVGGHCDLYWPVEKAIYSFHMQLFFLISGLFCQKIMIKTVFTSKARALLIPYLGAALICWIIFGQASVRNVESIRMLIEGIIFADGRQGLSFNSPLWFLPCLWSVYLIIALFEKFILHRTIRITALLLVGIISTIIITLKPTLLPLRLQTASYCLPFFLCGMVIGPYIRKVSCSGVTDPTSPINNSLVIRKSTVGIAAVLFTLAWVVFSYIDGNNYYVIAYDRIKPVYWFYLRGIFGAMSVICFSIWSADWLCRSHILSSFFCKIVKWLSTWSFGIFLFHKPIIIWLKEFNPSIFIEPLGSFSWIPLFIIGIVVPVFVLKATRVVFPRFVTILLGGRSGR